MLKKTIFYFSIFSSIFLLESCETSDVDAATGDWFKLSDLDGLARYAAVGFSIDGYGYLGMGADEDNYKLSDFWKYDPSRNTWTQVASFPGLARTAATGFSVDGKGYIGTGLDQEDNRLNDFWEFDPDANTWKQKSDFPGTGRRNAISFAIGSKGYLGTGFDGSYTKDFYSYDPSIDEWTKITSIGGSKRVAAAAFVIGNKGYVGTGNNNGVNLTDFWEYDPAQDLWTEKLDFDETTIARSYGLGFSLKNKGYFMGGSSSNDVWEFTPGGDDDLGTWSQVTSFEGSPRNYTVAWSINDEGYISTGSNGVSRYDDLWKFIPDIVQDDED